MQITEVIGNKTNNVNVVDILYHIDKLKQYGALIIMVLTILIVNAIVINVIVNIIVINVQTLSSINFNLLSVFEILYITKSIAYYKVHYY